MDRIKAALVAFLLSASPAALAQAPAMKLNMDTHFYVGAGVGRSEARNFCTIGGACDAKDLTWNLFAGYRFHRHFALEAAYTNFGEATTSGFVGGVPSTARTESTALELVAVGLVPLSDSFSLYGKAGFFRYDSDGSASGGLVAASSGKGTEFTFGVGAEYNFTSALAARVEWQRYLDVGAELLNVPKGDVTLLRVGARYAF